MKYYPWDEKLSHYHFLPRYASTVQAVVVCLSADDHTCVPHFDVIEMSEDAIRTRDNRYKLLSKHCHYDFRESREPRCLTVPNFIKIVPTVCEISCFYIFQDGGHQSWILKFLIFYWLTWSGGRRCITNPNFVQIDWCVVEIYWFHDFSIWLQLTIWSAELQSAFYPHVCTYGRQILVWWSARPQVHIIHVTFLKQSIGCEPFFFWLPVNSSNGHVVTWSTHHWLTRHRHIFSQSHLITSSSRHTVILSQASIVQS